MNIKQEHPQGKYGQKRRFDLINISIFIIIAIAFSTGLIGNHFREYIFLNSDAANISSFAAALDQPEFFQKDPLLSNPANFNFYYTLHIPLIRLLGQWTGNYGSGFAVLIFPFVLLHLIGYYLLGNVFFKNKFWSLLFSLMVMVPVPLNLGEAWGLMHDVVPRFLFQALLPFLLTLVLHYGRRACHWPWLLALTGCFVYIHPVSFPVWAVAVVLSLWVLGDQPWREKVSSLFFSGIVLGLVILPFVINYLSSTEFGSRDLANYNFILNIMRIRFIPGFLDLNTGFQGFINTAITSHWVNLLVWGIFIFIVIVCALRIQRVSCDLYAMILIVWWLSVLLVSVIIPLMDHMITAMLERFPLEVDLIRGLRYAIPLVLLSCFYFLLRIHDGHIKLRGNKEIPFRPLVTIIGIIIFILWATRYNLFENQAFVQTANCWGEGQLTCDVPDEELVDQRINVLNAIKELTPQDAGILGTDFSDLAIRYYTQRSLIYSYKDGGAFIYANHKNLMQWYEQFELMNEIEKSKQDRGLFLEGLIDFAQLNQGDFILLHKEESWLDNYLPGGVELIYSNPTYELLKIMDK